MTTTNKKITILLLQVFVSVLAGHVVWCYLRFPVHGAFSFICGIVVFMLIKKHVRVQSKLIWAFSALFALSLVLAKHIVISGGLTAHMDRNYITGYSWIDIVAFGVLLYVTVQLLIHSLSCLGHISTDRLFVTHGEDSIWTEMMKKPLWFYVIIMVICWLPWSLAWYPGFVYGDSISSVRQAQGLVAFNNHFPLTYTLWIKVWLTLGKWIHNVTFGAFLYTVTQMIIVAWGLAWSVRWMAQKGVNPAYCVFTIAYFALTPFFAQNNISMWKDPFFSVAGLIFCMCLYDFFASDNVPSRKDFVVLIFFAVIICLFRNNGAYVILFSALAMAGFSIFYKTILFRKRARKLSSILFAIAGIMLVIQGPVFQRLGLNPAFAETVGIPLNQMARVVAYDGKMSEANKEFMNHLLPIERIKGLYAPGYVDSYKWANGFNNYYLNTHKKEFLRNYFSMMAKNPRIAFEGWQIQTIGFWSINHFTFELDNVGHGCLWCLKWWPQDHGLKVKNLLENRFFDSRAVFSPRDATVPLGIITWIILLISVLSFMRRDAKVQMALLPMLGLIASLLLASPWHYWERYGYLLTLALPMLIVMLMRLSEGVKVNYEKRVVSYGADTCVEEER